MTGLILFLIAIFLVTLVFLALVYFCGAMEEYECEDEREKE